LDALIVRIMKSRKAIAHAQLVAEIIQQCKFPAPVPEIKKRIASLIERDYMERDPDNTNVILRHVRRLPLLCSSYCTNKPATTLCGR
jgi:hypothetical protein